MIENLTVEKLTIGKREYMAEIKELPQASLKFYEENPRIYSSLYTECETPSQDEIENYMVSMEHVKQLKTSIESNGGLIDPLIVRDGDFTVLEGNSRLAAYRILCQKDAIQWGKVKCKLLPSDIDDSAIFTLLGQYHIIGRQDWEPFEQANYLYRRHQETKLPIDYMAKELGITKQKATKMIEVVTFMISNNDLHKRHWSHYEEYLKNASIKKYRETNPFIDETIVTSVKNGSIKEAADMRKIGEIIKVGDKNSKKIMQKIAIGEMTIYNGHEAVQDSGKFDDSLKKLKKFRADISETSFEKQIFSSIDNSKDIEFEITKIIKQLELIKKKLGK